MADITQDLLQLQYSQNFPISGMQEAIISPSKEDRGGSAFPVFSHV